MTENVLILVLLCVAVGAVASLSGCLLGAWLAWRCIVPDKGTLFGQPEKGETRLQTESGGDFEED